MANLLEARDFDYVLGSVHFLGSAAIDMRGRVGHLALRRSRQGLATLLRDARRSRPQRHVRHPRAPRPRQGLGLGRPPPAGRPAPLLRSRDGRDRRVGRRDRGIDRRPAQAGERDLSRPARSSRCASRRAAPSPCRQTRTRRTTSPTAMTTRSSCSTRSASASSRSSNTAAARASSSGENYGAQGESLVHRSEPTGPGTDPVTSRAGIGYDSHRLRARPPAGARGRRGRGSRARARGPLRCRRSPPTP